MRKKIINEEIKRMQIIAGIIKEEYEIEEAFSEEKEIANQLMKLLNLATRMGKLEEVKQDLEDTYSISIEGEDIKEIERNILRSDWSVFDLREIAGIVKEIKQKFNLI